MPPLTCYKYGNLSKDQYMVGLDTQGLVKVNQVKAAVQQEI